jgi:hypothetical protein
LHVCMVMIEGIPVIRKMLFAIGCSIIFILTGCIPLTPASTQIYLISPSPTRSSTRTPAVIPTVIPNSFLFASLGDSHDEVANFTTTINQLVGLHPSFIIHNGDLENDGVLTSQMDDMVGVLTAANVFNNIFLVRGNHDDKVSGSASLWETYLTGKGKTLPNGVSNYVSLDSNSTFLNYSFDYGNSRFIGLDVPGDADLLTSAELNFLDDRLTDAENKGLTHAFIYYHGPEYCVESIHCTCTAKGDGSCTPPAFVNIVNKHPIVSATFHGHEHILGWVHMDSSRVPGLTNSYEEFLTSPSGGWTYNDYMYSDRIDYYYPDMDTAQGFATISVSGLSFTINFYRVGITAPVWTKTFTKGSVSAMSTPVFIPDRKSVV